MSPFAVLARRELADTLLGYGWWIDPAQSGVMDDVPSPHGSCTPPVGHRCGQRTAYALVFPRRRSTLSREAPRSERS